MKYSLPFYTTNPYLDTVDEIVIKYDASGEKSLISFLDDHPNQRVVLRIPKDNDLTEDNYKFLEVVTKMYAAGHVVCCFEAMNSSSLYTTLPHFYRYFCSDIEEVQALIDLGVTDIYVTGNLCYQLKQIKSKFKCNIRVFPNVAQSTIESSDIYKKFFIRPEDISLYEDYIDYIEFSIDSLARSAYLYKIYHDQAHYSGWLSEIIDGAPAAIHNDCLTSDLAIERLNCGKSCVYWGRKCNLCKSYFDLARNLYKNDLKIKEDK